MRNYILPLLFVLLSCSIASSQSTENSLRGVVATVNQFEYKSDSVYLSLELDLNKIEISSTESVVITPKIFKSVSQLSDLPTFVVNGRNSSKSYDRAITLNNRKKVAEYDALYKEPFKVVDHFGAGLKLVESVGGKYTYSYVAPYQTWMVDSEVILSSTTYGCCNEKHHGMFVPEHNNRLTFELLEVKPYTVEPSVSLIKPAKVAVKKRDINYSSSLVFRVNSSYIDPNLADNRKELSSIKEMLESVVSDKDYTITAINIIGYASPEGSLAGNKTLSERRAKALETLLKEEYDIAPEVYNVKFGGENWDALIPLVEASDMADKAEVLRIIKDVDIVNGRETMLMNLKGGVPYRYMLKNFFPAVRLVNVEVDYNVDAYDIERIGEVINTKPENLSLEEMYRLSETFDQSSPEFLSIFQKAVEVYPSDEIALNNAMVAEINNHNIELAEKFAFRIYEGTESAQVLNNLGVYYLMSEDYDKAKSLLRRAESLGSSDATQNLKQLESKLANIAKLEESEQLRIKIYGE